MLKKRFFKTKDDCEITFELEAEGAESAALVCEANGWQPVEMKPVKSKSKAKAKAKTKGTTAKGKGNGNGRSKSSAADDAAAAKFRTKLRLPKDSDFQFRYLVNERSWLNDDAADAYIPNEFGTHNSVISTRVERA